jgi:hypothetical protein
MHKNVHTVPSTGTVINRSGASVTAAQFGSQIVMGANKSRTYLVFQNISDTVMLLNFGETAGALDSISVSPGGSVTFNAGWVPSQDVYLRCSVTAKNFVAKEGV